ncbi:PQ-loop domain-containing transporter [Leifsonia shinshuensis]|uniref:MtN3 and saliva related transmembrane protein n=1 Tax=Leifsonia shinshuensis TaxID=150026 RepID=A0A853D4J9_9MICO|nr:MtN3 and saliva related transmembrane protein [Leifsonia shinshuensis]
MSVLQLLGGAAVLLTTGAWLPQLARCWRTRSAADISWGYLAALSTGVALWVGYGAAVGDAMVVAANCLTLGALATLMVFKLAFVRRRVESAPSERESDRTWR